MVDRVLRVVGRLRKKRIKPMHEVRQEKGHSEFDAWKHLALVMLGNNLMH